MEVGERIKELRKNQLGLTLEAFGKKLGVGKTAISKIEKGERNLTEQMAKAICREYNVDYFWLSEGIGEPFRDFPKTLIDEIAVEYDLDDFEESMIVEFVKLKKEERAAIVKYVKNLIKKEPD